VFDVRDDPKRHIFGAVFGVSVVYGFDRKPWESVFTHNMIKKIQQDEHLEQLWYRKEEGKPSVYFLKKAMNGAFDADVVAELASEGLVQITQNGENINLTAEGEERARRLIRAHRLAERLMHDVMGGEFEAAACEFEHTVSLALVDSICTLLGHPKECPHGLSIPEGECCKKSAKMALSFIVPFTEIKLGQSVRIAHINCRNDRQIHKLEGLGVRPGAVAKLHQNYPAYVIECEGTTIALDKEVAKNIYVWNDQDPEEASGRNTPDRNHIPAWAQSTFGLFKKGMKKGSRGLSTGKLK
jgi:DtxR family Mn-dependent transcriptional regulator